MYSGKDAGTVVSHFSFVPAHVKSNFLVPTQAGRARDTADKRVVTVKGISPPAASPLRKYKLDICSATNGNKKNTNKGVLYRH